MDMRALKVGQKVRIQIFSRIKDATVIETAEDYVRIEIAPSGPFTKWLQSPDLANPPEYNPENENGYDIDFRYDGSQCGVWEAGGVRDPRPIADLKIVEPCD
jgi:hypothetical protein